MNDESGELLTTADCHRCANRMLANVSLPQARVRYRAVGTDTSDRAFDVTLSSTNTYKGAKFRVEMAGVNPMEAETGQVLTITVTVYNLEPTEARYSFTPESVAGFRQVLRPTSLVVPPTGSGSVNMLLLPLPPTAPGTHTFTATVSDGCVTHSVSKTVTYITPVSIANIVVYYYISMLITTQVTTPPPVTNDCGCENGGTCIVRIIRRRRILRCACPEGHSGRRCENTS